MLETNFEIAVPNTLSNIEQIWNDHCLNKKPILAKTRKLRPRHD